MEERDKNEMSLMGKERENGDTAEEQTANMNTQSSEEDCVKMQQEMEESNEKGIEERYMKSELDADMKVKLCESVPDLQMSIIRDTDLFGYVGLEAVLEQMKLKTIKAGFEFNIMVVGECLTQQTQSDPWCSESFPPSNTEQSA